MKKPRLSIANHLRQSTDISYHRHTPASHPLNRRKPEPLRPRRHKQHIDPVIKTLELILTTASGKLDPAGHPKLRSLTLHKPTLVTVAHHKQPATHTRRIGSLKNPGHSRHHQVHTLNTLKTRHDTYRHDITKPTHPPAKRNIRRYIIINSEMIAMFTESHPIAKQTRVTEKRPFRHQRDTLESRQHPTVKPPQHPQSIARINIAGCMGGSHNTPYPQGPEHKDRQSPRSHILHMSHIRPNFTHHTPQTSPKQPDGSPNPNRTPTLRRKQMHPGPGPLITHHHLISPLKIASQINPMPGQNQSLNKTKGLNLSPPGKQTRNTNQYSHI